MIKTRNRYVIASAGITLHLMIGGVYAWRVFTGPIAKQTGWAETSVSFAFSLAIFFLGMSAAFMGRLVEKFGPTITGTISSVCYGLGVFLTGIAISNQQLWLLYLAYGVIGGLGLGAGYVTPVSTIIRWFPDKRGLATGLAIMGFGFAALLTGPIAQTLMASFGVSSTFYILGIFYFLVMIIAAQFIKKPRKNELPKAVIKKASHFSLTGQNMTANEAVRTPNVLVIMVHVFHQYHYRYCPSVCRFANGTVDDKHDSKYRCHNGRYPRFIQRFWSFNLGNFIRLYW